jgi:hypothetical protein
MMVEHQLHRYFEPPPAAGMYAAAHIANPYPRRYTNTVRCCRPLTMHELQ